MYELTYESEAIEGVTSHDVILILEESRIFNNKKDIPGCLVLHNRKFIQIIEGKRGTIQELYKKIKSDRRHTRIRLISEDPILKRTFPKRGMALGPIDNKWQ